MRFLYIVNIIEWFVTFKFGLFVGCAPGVGSYNIIHEAKVPGIPMAEKSQRFQQIKGEDLVIFQWFKFGTHKSSALNQTTCTCRCSINSKYCFQYQNVVFTLCFKGEASVVG